MTNNPTIDGEARELLKRCLAALNSRTAASKSVRYLRNELRAILDAENAGDPNEMATLREHCKQCAEVVKTWPEWKQNCLGGASAVERQTDPDCEWCGGCGHDHYGDPCTGCTQSEIAALQSTLFDAIAHGDDGHRDWLKSAIDAHFSKSPLPEYVPSGKDEKIDALQSTIAQLQAEKELMLRGAEVLRERIDELESGKSAGGGSFVEEIMSDKMREEFEAAVNLAFHQSGNMADLRQVKGQYVEAVHQSAWWGWKASRESQPPTFTAVDMANAARDGFRDGAASVVVDLPKMYPSTQTKYSSVKAAYNDGVRLCRRRIIAAGGSVKDE